MSKTEDLCRERDRANRTESQIEKGSNDRTNRKEVKDRTNRKRGKG